mgnify:CR=1 FL=1
MTDNGLTGTTIHETSAGSYDYTIEMYETHFEVQRHIDYEGYQHYVFRTIAEAMAGLIEIISSHTDYYDYEFTTFETIIITGRACTMHPLA